MAPEPDSRPLRLRRLQQERMWQVEGLPFRVTYRPGGGWSVRPNLDDTASVAPSNFSDAHRWLNKHRLLERFRSRADLLAILASAHQEDPLPSFPVTPQSLPLRRVSRGKHLSACGRVQVERHTDSSWNILLPDGAVRYAPTLLLAARQAEIGLQIMLEREERADIRARLKARAG